MKINYEGMQILMAELQHQEMWAIYLMGHGKEMTDVVTKLNLTRIIHVLCKKLNWIDEDCDQDPGNNTEGEKSVDNAPNTSTQGILNLFPKKTDETMEDNFKGPSNTSKTLLEDQDVEIKSEFDREMDNMPIIHSERMDKYSFEGALEIHKNTRGNDTSPSNDSS